MAAILAPLLHLVLVETCSQPGLPPFESCTLLLLIPCFHDVELIEEQNNANVFEEVFHESTQSRIDDEGKLLDDRDELFPDAKCGSLESVELLVAAAQKLLFFPPLINSKRAQERFSTIKGRSSSSLVLSTTEIANLSHAWMMR